MLIQLLIGTGLLLLSAVRPGIDIVVRDQPPPRSAPTDTGVWFVCGLSEKGPLAPTLIESMSQYLTMFGQRVSYGILYDALDAFFREGGRSVYISRVVGPASVLATGNLVDAVAAISLVAKAKNPGDWGNQLKVKVVAGGAGGTFQIQVTDLANVVLEQSSDLVDTAAAVAWSASSSYVTLTQGASVNDPAVQSVTLAGGTDDRANITDTHWGTALDLFSRDLGPGQVSHPGRTGVTAQQQLLNHAQAMNRRALVDLPDSAVSGTLIAAVAALRGVTARFGAAFSPWAVIPGIAPGTTRTVPYCAIEAGIIARNDASLSADYASAGQRGEAQYAIGLSQVFWNETTRQALNDAGVNVAIVKYGGVRTYGYRTLVDANADPNWIDFAGSRLVMEIAALGDPILESHLFDPIDGGGREFAAIAGELTGMVAPYYADGSLYGATPEEAFLVDTGSSVNTPQTIADGEIHAAIGLRISPTGEFVQLELVKVRVDQSL